MATTQEVETRPFMDSSRPGRLDREGVEWYATDPYPTWFRHAADGEIVHKPFALGFSGWANEPKPVGKQPCGPRCRLISFSDVCACQGWCA